MSEPVVETFPDFVILDRGDGLGGTVDLVGLPGGLLLASEPYEDEAAFADAVARLVPVREERRRPRGAGSSTADEGVTPAAVEASPVAVEAAKGAPAKGRKS